MEAKFYTAMVMAGLGLVLMASKRTMPFAIILMAASVYFCCSIVPDVIAAAG